MRGRRKDQMLQVRADIADLERAGKDLKRMKFKKLMTVLVNGYRNGNIHPARYTAMVKSVVLGNTTDEDVMWHY